MSTYHKDCCKPKLPPKPNKLLTSKAFCDCNRCICKDCPDILKLLSITVTDTTCEFGSKMKSASGQNDSSESPESQNQHDVIKIHGNSCTCDIVARGVRGNIHMNLGMTQRRNEIADFVDCCNKCKPDLSQNSAAADNTVNIKDSKCTTDKDHKIIDNNEKCSLCSTATPR